MKRRVRLIVTKIFRQTTAWEKPVSAFCSVCEQETEMLTTTESAGFLEIEKPMLDALIASGKIHTVETVNANLRVCKNSLFAKDVSAKRK